MSLEASVYERARIRATNWRGGATPTNPGGGKESKVVLSGDEEAGF